MGTHVEDDALHADLVQIRNFFKRPVQSRESCLPTGPTVITTDLGPTSTQISTATATDHEPWDTSVTPSSTAAAAEPSTVGTVWRRTPAPAPLLLHGTCTTRAPATVEHAAAMSDRQIGPLLPCARKSRALASHTHGGCVRHARARVSRVGRAPQAPPACI